MLKLLLSNVFPCIFLTLYGGVGITCIHGHKPRLDIIGGNSTDINQHPYQVVNFPPPLQVLDTVSIWADEELRGSGALIREDWVVTTASTVFGFDQSTLKVRAYSSHAEDGGRLFKINKFLTHPKFRYSNMSYDVALLRLAKVMMTIVNHTVPISKTSMTDNTTSILTGYGATNNTTKMSNQLRQVPSRIIDKQSCQVIYGEDFIIGTSQFCAQADNVFGPCWGDNGDLLMSGGELYGLLSWNRGCFDQAEPSVFTDLSLSRTWINRAIKKHTPSKARKHHRSPSSPLA